VLSPPPAGANAVTAPVPSCRLDGAFAVPLADATRRALDHYRLGDPVARTITGISLNSASADASVIELYIVKDAFRDEVDSGGCVPGAPKPRGDSFDLLTVTDVCHSSDNRHIFCSAGSIRTLLDSRASAGPSPSLLYLMAHELAHLLGGSAGGFHSPPATISGSLDARSKIAALKKGCEWVGPEIAREQDADARALNVLAALLRQSPYEQIAVGARASLTGHVDALRLDGERLEKWETSLRLGLDKSLMDALDSASTPASPKQVALLAKSSLAHILRPGSGTILLPPLRGTHPTGASRLAATAAALTKLARTLSPSPPPTSPVSDPVSSLLSNGGAILSVIDQDYADLVARTADEICHLARLTDPGKLP
jgi:hypothetical protein